MNYSRFFALIGLGTVLALSASCSNGGIDEDYLEGVQRLAAWSIIGTHIGASRTAIAHSGFFDSEVEQMNQCSWVLGILKTELERILPVATSGISRDIALELFNSLLNISESYAEIYGESHEVPLPVYECSMVDALIAEELHP